MLASCVRLSEREILDIIIEEILAVEKKGAQELMNVTTGKHTLGCK